MDTSKRNNTYGIAFLLVAVMAVRKQRDAVSVSGVGMVALLNLLNIVMGSKGISLIINLIPLLAIVSLTFIVVVSMTEWMPDQKELAKKIWFLPIVLNVISAVINLVIMPALIGMPVYNSIINFVFSVVNILGYWFIIQWALYPEGKPGKVQAVAASGSGQAINAQEYGEGYCDMLKHVLLLLFIGGIWMYIWIYRTTKFLNCVEGEEYRNPTTKLLLCMFVPFYSIYWTYKSALRIDKLAASKGVSSDLGTLCLILAIIIGIIPPILMQDKINAIVRAK